LESLTQSKSKQQSEPTISGSSYKKQLNPSIKLQRRRKKDRFRPSKIASFKRGERRVEETHTVKRRPALRPHHHPNNQTRTRTSTRPSSPPEATDAGEQKQSKGETSTGAGEATGYRSQI
ncbi:unnamed protein product, partial [Arabidopsis halleri]